MSRIIDMMAVMQHVPDILGMELTWRKDAWEGRYYLNGDRHPYKKDKLKVKFWKAPDGRTHIVLYEQGGPQMSLQTWLVQHGGAMDWKHARDVMRGCQPCALELGGARLRREAEVRYVPREVFEQYKAYELERSNLYLWMCRMFGESNVREAWERYNVTTNERGEVVFWFVDPEGRILHDKIFRYGSNGKRDKQFVRRKYKVGDGFNGRCFFGSHLIEPGVEINVCESEKTALLSYLHTGKLFVATGGKSNLRDVDENMILWPDLDAVEDWSTINGARIKEWWSDCDFELGSHDDYGDVIVREKLKNVYMGRYRD